MSRERTFTAEQIEWVRESIQSMSTRACAAAFSETFKEKLGQTELRRMMKRNNIAASASRNAHLPIGTERYSRYYDCMMVKVSDSRVAGLEKGSREFTDIRNSSWKMKQNLIWEQKSGKPIPPHHVVVFLDGNRMNYDPDNLYAVPLNVVGTIKKMRMKSENPDIYKTALVWGKLYFTLKGGRSHEETGLALCEQGRDQGQRGQDCPGGH